MDHLLATFEADWQLAQRATQTVKTYLTYLKTLFTEHDSPDASDVKKWLAKSPSTSVRRKRAQAVRAFGKWAELNQLDVFAWWRTIPVPKDPVTPQLTVTHQIYEESLRRAKTVRDRALIEVLWSTGLRRSEIARLDVLDLNLSEGFIVVKTAKSGKPRIAPLSPDARRSLARLLGRRKSGSVFGWTSDSIRTRLVRLGLPSAHAWRRGWAVQALRLGVSETSVRSAAGWTTGAMVARYTSALSGELALTEFGRIYGMSPHLGHRTPTN